MIFRSNLFFIFPFWFLFKHSTINDIVIDVTIDDHRTNRPYSVWMSIIINETKLFCFALNLTLFGFFSLFFLFVFFFFFALFTSLVRALYRHAFNRNYISEIEIFYIIFCASCTTIITIRANNGSFRLVYCLSLSQFVFLVMFCFSLCSLFFSFFSVPWDFYRIFIKNVSFVYICYRRQRSND